MDCFFGWLDMIIEEKTERRELTVDLGTVDFWTTWKWSLNVWCCGMWDSKPWVGFPSQCLLTFNGWMVLQYFFCIPRARKHRCWYIYIYISYAAAPLHTFSRLCGPIIYNTQSEVPCCRKVQSSLMCVCLKWFASVSIGNSCDCLTLKQSVQRSFFTNKIRICWWTSQPLQTLLISTDRWRRFAQRYTVFRAPPNCMCHCFQGD